MSFRDHFSTASADYRRFRPRYPDELFAWLAAEAPGRELAWDCATGNGQAAVGLAAHVARVVATDASAAQLAAAEPHPRVEYRLARAEASGLETASVDLITVAQALHWFDVDAFHAEARRVLRPGGVIAEWSYARITVTPEIDAVIEDLYANTLATDWLPERRFVEEGYRSLPFPFAELSPPPFALEARLGLEGVLGYIGTWSAVLRHRQRTGHDPIPPFAAALAPLWGDGERVVRWSLALRVGRREG